MIFTKQLPVILLVVLVLLMFGVGAAAFVPPPPSSPALYFLNVGQGDSELIVLAGGVKVLIDGGPSGPSLLANLSKILPAQDRYIDLLIMTHPQTDHFAGFIDLLKTYKVGAFIGNLRRGESAAYDELRHALVDQKVPYVQLTAGDVIAVGESMLSVISPTLTNMTGKELNDTCEVVLLATPELRALYTGDIGTNIEKELVGRYGRQLDVDVLKVGHHGSRFSSGDEFVRATSPVVAVIEVGKNAYGHPTKQALARLSASGARVVRTDEQGIIKISMKNHQFEVAHKF